jgi:hypothetical protein
MVFSNDEQVERKGSGGEDKILSQNFGGLNLTASNINCPYEDSPLLMNVDVDISGRIRKRKGTRVLRESARTQSRGYTLIPIQTGLGYTYIVEKIGKDLLISDIKGGVLTEVSTKSNVWDDNAKDVKATWSVSSEIVPKVFLCTGANHPVRLSVVERQTVASATGTTATFDYAIPDLTYVAVGNSAVYVNGDIVTPSGFTAVGTTQMRVDGIAVTAGDVVDVVFFTWQHCVDAQIWLGSRAFDVVTRFNTTVTDQVVAVPDDIRAEPWFGDTNYQYGIRAWSTNNYSAGNAYSLDTAREPSTSTEYAFSNVITDIALSRNLT